MILHFEIHLILIEWKFVRKYNKTTRQGSGHKNTCVTGDNQCQKCSAALTKDKLEFKRPHGNHIDFLHEQFLGRSEGE